MAAPVGFVAFSRLEVASLKILLRQAWPFTAYETGLGKLEDWRCCTLLGLSRYGSCLHRRKREMNSSRSPPGEQSIGIAFSRRLLSPVTCVMSDEQWQVTRLWFPHESRQVTRYLRGRAGAPHPSHMDIGYIIYGPGEAAHFSATCNCWLEGWFSKRWHVHCACLQLLCTKYY